MFGIYLSLQKLTLSPECTIHLVALLHTIHPFLTLCQVLETMCLLGFLAAQYLWKSTLAHKVIGLLYILHARLEWVPKISFVHIQASFLRRPSDSLPSHKVHFSLDSCGVPDEVSLNCINLLAHLGRQFDILHDCMTWLRMILGRTLLE